LAEDQEATATYLEGETFMRHFVIAIAVVGIAALAAGAPASAQQIHQPGGPIKQGSQCWKHHGAGSDHLFGSMEACPQPASTTATSRAARKRS
jgi:hypothetical protein